MERTRILVWDLPLRVFHWLLAISFAGAMLTAESERLRDVHVALGYAFGGLLAFRLLWGLVGSRYARFSSFAFGPKAVAAYLRSLVAREPDHHVGHNPAGAWAIYAMLAAGFATAATGLVLYEGPGGRWLEGAHEAAATAVLALVILHVAGVAVASFLHRENLPAAMVTGRKIGSPAQAIARPRAATAIALAIGVAALAAAALLAPERALDAGATAHDGGADRSRTARHGAHGDDT